jgi:hypothetical protein
MMHEIIFGERSKPLGYDKRLQSSLIEQAVLYLKVETTCKAHWLIVDCDMIARSSLALLKPPARLAKLLARESSGCLPT